MQSAKRLLNGTKLLSQSSNAKCKKIAEWHKTKLNHTQGTTGISQLI